jgi:hypothetical protein
MVLTPKFSWCKCGKAQRLSASTDGLRTTELWHSKSILAWYKRTVGLYVTCTEQQQDSKWARNQGISRNFTGNRNHILSTLMFLHWFEQSRFSASGPHSLPQKLHQAINKSQAWRDFPQYTASDLCMHDTIYKLPGLESLSLPTQFTNTQPEHTNMHYLPGFIN